MSRPTAPEVARALVAGGVLARVALATVLVPGEGGARRAEGVRVEGTAEPVVARPAPLPGWDTPAVIALLARAFPSCDVFETGYYTLFLCPRRKA